MKICKLSLLIHTLLITLFAQDLIIDKQGNEFSGKIIKNDDALVSYLPDSNSPDSIITLKKSEIFMIKYSDGRKEVADCQKRKKNSKSELNSKVSVAIQGQVGTFGLFNVNNEFTKSEITLGVTPSVDIRLNRIFSLGAEYMLLFGKPETKDVARFIMNPNIRGKVTFPVKKRLLIDIIVAGGVSIWPGSEDTAYINPTFFDTRVGWDAHAALGMDLLINSKFSIVLDLGYIANSSASNNVWITHDMMLVSLGPQIRF